MKVSQDDKLRSAGLLLLDSGADDVIRGSIPMPDIGGPADAEEMSTFRVRATGLVKKPELSVATSGGRSAEHALVERRPAYVRKVGAVQEVAGYDFARLLPGNEIQGPAIIWSPITTIVLDPDQTARMDGYKNLVIGRDA